MVLLKKEFEYLYVLSINWKYHSSFYLSFIFKDNQTITIPNNKHLAII